ncbi:cell division protein FtsK [Clostridiales bacterium PH28_bin88]|nr:cell division protein FtsK [Clostridiales bacterium PH28_bin88]
MQKKPAKNNKPSYGLRLEIGGLALLALGIFSLISLIGGSGGVVGGFLVRTLTVISGEGKYLLPFFISGIGIGMVWRGYHELPSPRIAGMVLFYGVIVTWLHLRLGLPMASDNLSAGMEGFGGGVLGAGLTIAIRAAFGLPGSYIVLTTLGLVSLLLVTGKSLAALGMSIVQLVVKFYTKLRIDLTNFLFTTVEEEEPVFQPVKRAEVIQPVIVDHTENVRPRGKPLAPEAPSRKTESPANQPINQHREQETEKLKTLSISSSERVLEYMLPPITLLPNPVRLRNTRVNKDIADKVKILEDTLESFGVKGKVTQVSLGPAITRFELQPAPGVKVSKIVSLADDIALSMAAPDVRIEAPIPGKAAVGIEVPNKEVSLVHFREVLETPEFHEATSKLTVALGKDIAGHPIVADLEKMPHLLIAGATGSGKSVCMNALIVSLLFKSKPNELKFLMIDPKMVELTTYNGIPHLIAPVVTEPKKAATVLRWIVNEMENRYELFATAGVRDIIRYNALKAKETPDSGTPSLPYVVVLIDELADLMMVAPADVEDAICRLAQMARAAGIHLVVATQRPSVDVITGVIKANIPSRIAFAVSSQTDSRTILDMGGAEKLLGRGDMLFFPVGASKPVRVQGVFVSDKEVDDIVTFLKGQGKPEYEGGIGNLEVISVEPKKEEEDDLLPEAVRLMIETGQASISMLQRRLHIGYTRAARLMDLMEQKGIVGGYEGSKPRAVIANWDDYQQMFGQS